MGEAAAWGICAHVLVLVTRHVNMAAAGIAAFFTVPRVGLRLAPHSPGAWNVW